MERSLAYLVGSMEGPDSGGDYRESGQLMYFLAKKKLFCFQYMRCKQQFQVFLTDCGV